MFDDDLSDEEPPVTDPGDQVVNSWAMAIHLSQLANFVMPVAGIIIPIVLWQIKTVELPALEIHGKIVVNWMISLIIYCAISIALCFVLVGFPLLILLGVLSVIYPIIGGVKASQGIAWRYPGSISFI